MNHCLQVNFLYFQTGSSVEEFLGQHPHNQPFILAIGQRIRPSSCYVVLGKHVIQHASLVSAVDSCFKLFYVLDLHYPNRCTSVWEFFEGIVYSMQSKMTKMSPAVKVMRSLFEFEKKTGGGGK